MIQEFRSGKWYRCLRSERPDSWPSDGSMDFVLDGRTHRCEIGESSMASFFDSNDPGIMYAWDITDFEEMTPEGIPIDFSLLPEELDFWDAAAQSALRAYTHKWMNTSERGYAEAAAITADLFVLERRKRVPVRT